MKHNQQKKIKKITISLFFTLSIFVLFGQSIPMVAESNVWYERGEYGGWGPYPEQDRYITHYFEGDTIINGQSYKKLYEDFRDTIFSTPVFIQDHFSYEAAMRQDGELVYYILPGNTAEALYADFNIGLGDTLNYFQNTLNATVVAIDSFQLGSETISSYQLSNGAYFYEAIGGSFGPFRDYSIGIEGGTYLVCFHYYQNSVGVGPWFSSYDCNPSYTYVNIAQVDPESIQIYPNPTSDYINIKRDEDEKMKIQLYNLFGERVYVMETKSAVFTVQTSELTSGLYLLSLEIKGQTINNLIIVK